MRAMIAMSGGVDSSVAALLMKEAGYDCTGVTMRLYRESGYPTSCEKSCCSDADEEYAALVCWQLGIAHESMCFSKSFEQAVIRRFIQEYEAGRTPNPCIDCNRRFGKEEGANGYGAFAAPAEAERSRLLLTLWCTGAIQIRTDFQVCMGRAREGTGIPFRV